MISHVSRDAHSMPSSNNIHRTVLPNGIVVISRSNFNSLSVVISGYLLTGGLFDTEEKLGLANFTTSAFMRGSEQREFQQIYDALESVGASLGFNASTHTTGFSGRCLVEDLPLLFDLLADALRRPVFPVEQVERLRAQLLTGLAIRAQDTSDMASMTFDQIVFYGHPYSRPDDGYTETVKAIKRDDLASFHRSYYGPKGMVIAIVGAVEASDAVEQAQRVLGDWENPNQPDVPELPELNPLKKTMNLHSAIPGKSQADIVLGTSGPKRTDPEYMAASLGNSILGQFGLMGRIGDVVRERSGLAYYASSSLSAGVGPGAWYVSAGVNPSNVQKTIDLIIQELTNFVEEGVTAEELHDSQANFFGRLPLSLESNAGVANALLNIERYELGLDYYLHYPDLVRVVTVEDVLVTARKYIYPDRLAVATAGPD